MSFRIQFTISDKEKTKLERECIDEGCPNISELCKLRALKGNSTYAELYKDMVLKIENLPQGQEFFLRDLINTPPTLLGRWLYDNVKDGIIPNVEYLGKGSDAAQYKKIK